MRAKFALSESRPILTLLKKFTLFLELVSVYYILTVRLTYYHKNTIINIKDVNYIMLAENIRRLRKKKGLSQEKLARLADISNNTLIKIEQGIAKEPTITTVSKVASALGVSIDELVKGSKNR